MRFLLKAIGILLLLAAVALVGYAALFDIPAPLRDITLPVEPR